LLSLMVIVATAAFLAMPIFASYVAPGFEPIYRAKLIVISRIMLLSPVLMGLSNLFGTVTQLFRKFFVYSLSPVFYNIGIILGVTVFYPAMGIYGLATGVALGAFMHFGVQAFASHYSGFTPGLSFSIAWKDVKKVAYTSLPRTIGLALNNMSLIAIISLASYL